MSTYGKVIASADETDGRLSVLEVSGGRGTMPPLHVHRTDDEVFHVIEGELTAYVGDAVVHLGSGDTGFAPRDVPHTYRVESDGARWLTVGAPGGLDRYFLAIGRPAGGDGPRPSRSRQTSTRPPSSSARPAFGSSCSGLPAPSREI